MLRIALYSATVTLSCVSPFNSSMFRRMIVDETNFFRDIHDVEPVVTDKQLERSAQLWAEYLATTTGKNCIHHSLYGGENIYFLYSFKAVNELELAKKAVTAFYEEIKYYSFENPGMIWPAAHFTQMTWKGVERVGVGIFKIDVSPGDRRGGCGISSSREWPATAFFVVVHHAPHGNVMTPRHFQQNVLKPRNPPRELDFQWEGNVTTSTATSCFGENCKERA